MKIKKIIILLIILIINLINVTYASSSSEIEIADEEYKLAYTNSSVYNPNTGKTSGSNSTNSTSNTTKPSSSSVSIDTPADDYSGTTTSGGSSSGSTVDSIMSAAKSFITTGEGSSKIDSDQLKKTSDFLYNLLLGAGIIVAVIVGIILGVKYMIGSTDEQADIKQILIPYVVGCFVVFGAFGIWKIAVNILSNM